MALGIGFVVGGPGYWICCEWPWVLDLLRAALGTGSVAVTLGLLRVLCWCLPVSAIGRRSEQNEGGAAEALPSDAGTLQKG